MLCSSAESCFDPEEWGQLHPEASGTASPSNLGRGGLASHEKVTKTSTQEVKEEVESEEEWLGRNGKW